MNGKAYQAPGADHPSASWTQEQRDEVAVLLRNGLTAKQIAARFCRSRNAVIGIVGRDKVLKAIGFARARGEKTGDAASRIRKQVPARPKKRCEQRAGIISKSQLMPAVVNAIPVLPPQTAGVSLMDLGPRHCRFCINEPEKGANAHLFCGEETEPGSPWCAWHEQIVWGRGTAAETKDVRSARRIAA